MYLIYLIFKLMFLHMQSSEFYIGLINFTSVLAQDDGCIA